MEITAALIAKFLAERDDFALELFAYRTLRSNGWRAHIGATYTDPYTGKPRQYDVRGHKQIAPGCIVSLAIECKSLSPEFPLVISRIPRPTDEDVGHDLILQWGKEQNVHSAVPEEQIHGRVTVERSEPVRLHLYASGEMVGKATNQIRYNEKKDEFTASDSETFDKWSQALASASGLMEMAATSTLQTPALTFVMPVLLVNDKTLWVVDYDTDGLRREPQSADEALLYVAREHQINSRSGSLYYSMTHLHIYTRTGLSGMLRNYDSATGHMFDKTFGSMFVKYQHLLLNR
jgi:hypothetical protein